MLVRPDDLIDAAQRLNSLREDIAAANATAARSMTNIAAAAQDEVSQSVASLFSAYGQQTQAAVEQHAAVGTGQFAQKIASAASGYSDAEATGLNWLLVDPFIGAIEYAQRNPLEALLGIAALPIIVPLTIFAVALVGSLFAAVYVTLVLMGQVRPLALFGL